MLTQQVGLNLCGKQSHREPRTPPPPQLYLPLPSPAGKRTEAGQVLFCQKYLRRENTYFCSFVLAWPQLLGNGPV